MARGEWQTKIFEQLAVNGTAGCSWLTGYGKVSTIRDTKEFAFYIRRSNAKMSKSANYSDFDISWRMFRFAILLLVLMSVITKALETSMHDM